MGRSLPSFHTRIGQAGTCSTCRTSRMWIPHPGHSPRLHYSVSGGSRKGTLGPARGISCGMLLQHATARRSEFINYTFCFALYLQTCDTDVPMSKTLRSSQDLVLTQAHLQLAAQVPSEWMRNEQSYKEARLALRKIVWRALLEDRLQAHWRSPQDTTSGSTSGSRTPEDDRPTGRLGRLSDSAYATWDAFASAAQRKMGSTCPESMLLNNPVLGGRVEVFHVLRCIVGPVVESLILLDRLVWLREELQVSSGVSLKIVVCK